MSAVEALRARLPENARDTKLNLQSVLQPGTLTAAQRWGVAVASAAAARNPRAARRDARRRARRSRATPSSTTRSPPRR